MGIYGSWFFAACSDVAYLLRAPFTGDDQGYADAQVLDTEAEGVTDGSLTIVETDGTVALDTNRCAFTAQATPAWGDLGFYSQAITRALGRTLFSTWQREADGTKGGPSPAGWNTAADVARDTNEGLLYPSSSGGVLKGYVRYGATQIEVFSYAGATDYIGALVLGGYDANGVPWHEGETPADYKYGCTIFLKGGAYTEWTLLYRFATGITATLYAYTTHYNAAAELDDFKVPDVDLSAVLEPVALSTFTADNGTSLDAITPEVGDVWSEELGGWETQANEAQPVGVAPAAPEFMAVADSGASDILLRTTITLGAVIAAGPLIRYDATPEFWYVDVNPATGNFSLYEYTGAAFILRDNVAAGVGAGTYEVTVIADGQDISCFLDGVLLLSWGAAATNETETQHGIRAVDLVPSFDNFHVHALRSDTYDDELNLT